jgi:hypothetical protein
MLLGLRNNSGSAPSGETQLLSGWTDKEKSRRKKHQIKIV